MKLKKLLAMVTASAMMVGMLGTTAFAAEPGKDYEAKNTYVLNYADAKMEGYEGWEAKRLYFSPFRTDIWVMEEGSLSNWNWCTATVYNMIDTSKIDGRNADYPYASIPAYCVDAVTNAVSTYSYQRVNLEDSSYFSDEVAGRIRAIFLNSFPYEEDMGKITESVNAWIDNSGSELEKVFELNRYEVISAAQSVIWTLTNNGKIAGDGYAGWQGYDNRNLASIYDIRDIEKASLYSANNISAVMQYLLALEPMAAPENDKLINEDAFVSVDSSYIPGTGVMTVKATVNAVVNEEVDKLTLTAVANGKVVGTAAVENGKNEYTFTFEGVDENTAVKLAIDGVQSAADVFLFDPLGEREDSQSMAGYDSSALPVHAEYVVGPDRIINLTKSTIVAGEGGATTSYQLEGIEFDVYYAGSVNDYNDYVEKNGNPVEILTDTETGKETVTVKEGYLTAVKTEENFVTTLETDITGKATYNLTDNKKPDGVYLIVEKAHPAIKAPLAPFLIAVPMTSEDGTGLQYTVNLQPKNDVVDGPEIRKDVKEIDNDLASFDANEVHTWIISADIPVDIAEGKVYTISDSLDYRLTYKDNLKVTVADKDAVAGADTVVLSAEDYTVAVTPGTVLVEEVEEAVTSFTVSLTEAGMDKLAGYTEKEIRVYFDAVIDEDAQMGEKIPNQAALTYTNSVNFTFDKESDKPEVYTCGINLYKYAKGEETKALANAKFKLARVATQEEIDAGEATSLVVGFANKEKVVYVDFYDNADWTVAADETTTDGETATNGKVDVVTTDAEGKAMLYGLEAGDYYLVEIQAPAGYNMLNYPIEVTLNETSASEDNVVKVANSDGFQLPATGGMGTVLFTVVGAGIVSGAGVSLVFKKRREDEE